jgi:hypothetical protein
MPEPPPNHAADRNLPSGVLAAETPNPDAESLAFTAEAEEVGIGPVGWMERPAP